MSSEPEKYTLHVGAASSDPPKIPGSLTANQRKEVECMTMVPEWDGCLTALAGVPGTIDSRQSEMLIQFRGSVLSKMISVEYHLASVPLHFKLRGESDFHTEFWKGMNSNSKMMYARIKSFTDFVNETGTYLTTDPQKFEAAATRLLNARNALAHYPIQGISNRSDNTLTPFVYRASKSEFLIFDTDGISKLEGALKIVMDELSAQLSVIRASN